MLKRVIFYIDGFNFYHGLSAASKEDWTWRKFYWLDFIKLANQFLDPKIHQLIAVKYFTAQPLEPGKQMRQALLFKANYFINNNKFIVINGKYYKKNIKCKNCGKSFKIHEEKRTDVNISVEIMRDACKMR